MRSFGLFCLAACLGHAAAAETLIVPDDFSTIQGAIDEAEENDVVLVEPGRYVENLTLRSGVDVGGRETARTLIAPDDASVPTVTIDTVSGIRFSNFTLIDSQIAVSVLGSAGIDVANVVFDRASEIGLAVDVSSVEAVNNVFFQNDTAISRGTAAVEIVNNIFAGNGTAIVTPGDPFQPFVNVRSNCYFRNDASPSDADGEAGTAAVFGDPRFVATDQRDFHLREGSACIDIGRGLDAIDDTTADAGAHGGELADAFPFPVGEPTLREIGDAAGGFGIEASWDANESYRVTSSTNPGGYRVYYVRGALPETPAGYDGDDAAAGPSPLDVGSVTSFTLEGLDAAVEPPLAPRLIDAQGRNESVVLEWEAVAGADAYRIHYGVADTGENQVEVSGGSTQHVVAALENGTTYVFAVSAVARATYHVAVSVLDNTPERHESALSPPATIGLGDDAESALSAALSATPTPLEAFPPLADRDECFIATAAFGSKSAADVAILRAFRDRFLLTNAWGRRLVELYYRWSPPAAGWLDAHAAWKPVVRILLKPAVIAALVALEGGPIAIGALVVLSAAGLASVVARRRRVRDSVQRGARAGRRAARERARCVRSRHVRALVAAVGGSVLALAAVSAAAQGGAPPAAGTPFGRSPPSSSPRWMYAITGGYTYPDLDDYAAFYGDDRATSYSVSGAYRLRDWLEVGARIGFRQDEGIGRTAEGMEIEDAVELTVMPLHVFADFIFERPGRRWAPYAGIGIGGAWYRQEIVLQSESDGRSDLGVLARAGWRWRFMSEGSRESAARPGGSMFARGFVLIEAEHFDAEVDDIDLGGTAYRVGVRFEFEP